MQTEFHDNIIFYGVTYVVSKIIFCITSSKKTMVKVKIQGLSHAPKMWLRKAKLYSRENHPLKKILRALNIMGTK